MQEPVKCAPDAPAKEPEFIPYVKSEQSMQEFSVRAFILGMILAIVFGAANAFLGMKVGMTISASIPAAVISMAILRGIMRSGTVLENNIVQTIASTGESMAAGIIFTVPGFLVLRQLLRTDASGISEYGLPTMPDLLITFIVALLGGCLGVLMMIPLRRYLIVKEHGKLPYPEGTACAEVLIAGESGGVKAKNVFAGIFTGAIYKFLMSGLALWKDEGFLLIPRFNRAAVAFDPSAALLGVGFIIGPRIAAFMLAGGVIGWLVIIPLIGTFANAVGPGFILPPGTKPLALMTAGEMASSYLRYIGAGAVAVGGLISLIKGLPVIIDSFRHGIIGMKSRMKESGSGEQVKRTERDISMASILIGCLVIIVVMAAVKQIPVGVVGAAFAVVFTFFFVSVSSRITGIVGSSSNPVSGMTITTLLVVSLVFAATGGTGIANMTATLMVGAIVCIAISCAGDISQDLKTGFLLGSTPSKQQIAQLLSVLIPTIAIVLTVYLVVEAYGLNTLPGYESKEISFTQDNLVKQSYDGAIDFNSKDNLSIEKETRPDGAIPGSLDFKADGKVFRTSLDTLNMKDGTALNGKMIEKDTREVRFFAVDNNVTTVPLEQIASISKGKPLVKPENPENINYDESEKWYVHVESPIRGFSKYFKKIFGFFSGNGSGNNKDTEIVKTSLDTLYMKDGAIKEGKIFMTSKEHDKDGNMISCSYQFKNMDNSIETITSDKIDKVESGTENMGKLRAPQANIMAMLTKGVISGKLPWAWLLAGAFLALAVELLGIASLPFAIGLYLGIGAGLPIMIGGFAFWILKRLTKPDELGNVEQKSTLFASGIIAGDALIGIIVAFVIILGPNNANVMAIRNLEHHSYAIDTYLPFMAFIAITIAAMVYIKRKERN